MGPWIMFTKHLEGWDLGQIIDGLQRGGVQGADLCVRPGYPVTPENAAVELPAAARRFADAGLSIPLITTPGDFVDPGMDYAESLFAACAEAGVQFVKLGYWYQEADGYWPTLDRNRKQLEGFTKLAEKTGVKPLVHNHSGATMGCNSSAVMRLMEGFDPKLVGVFGDVGHLSVVGEPYPMAFSIVQDYLCALAFKDLIRKRGADGTWGIDVWPLGMGVGNFPQVMQLVKDMAFKGPISFHCEYSQMPPESIIHQLSIDTKFVGDIVAKLH
jgi:sugar phosphate isomerase/epimerase